MNDLRPQIAVLASDHAEGLAKRLWAALPSRDYELAIYKDTGDVLTAMNQVLLVFVDLQNLSLEMVEKLYAQSLKCECPAEIVGVVMEESGADYQDAAKCCDIWLFFSQLGDAMITARLRHRLHRALAYYNLMHEKRIADILRMALAGTSDAHAVFDSNGSLIIAGGPCVQVFGSTAAENFEDGKSVEEMCALIARDISLPKTHPLYGDWEQIWLKEEEGEKVFPFPENRLVKVRAFALPDGKARVITATDMTLLQRQQSDIIQKTIAIEESLAKEKESNILQQQFISMVSHEFRTPLSLIDGNAQLVMRHVNKGEMEGVEKRVRTIRSAVSRLVQMMEGILSSNLLRTGKMVLKREMLDLEGLIGQLCEEQRDLSPDNKITWQVENLPAAVALDPKLITQILTNLLSNAVKYGGKKPVVTVTACVHDGEVVLSVADNGVGIPEDEKYKIFDRFFRATTSSGIPGTGIGLSLVKELVALHGGRIEVQSTVGQGTSFTIYLPLKDSIPA